MGELIGHLKIELEVEGDKTGLCEVRSRGDTERGIWDLEVAIENLINVN